MRKKFRQLNDQDTLWYINPITQKIDGLKIKYISGIAPEEVRKQEGGKYYVSIEVYRNDAVVQATMLDNIPTITFYLDGREEFQICPVNVQILGQNTAMPVPYAANKEVLREFMGQSAQFKTRKYNG